MSFKALRGASYTGERCIYQKSQSHQTRVASYGPKHKRPVATVLKKPRRVWSVTAQCSNRLPLQRHLSCKQTTKERSSTVSRAAVPNICAQIATADTATLSHILAVGLGYACMMGSCFRSIPQVAKIVKARSVEGVSLTSNVVELGCYTINVAYNMALRYPFNTYGEAWACWVQDVVMVALLIQFSTITFASATGWIVGFGALSAYLFFGTVPLEFLAFLQLSTNFVMAFGSRVPQIVLNVKRGNSGMLSLTTAVLNVAGNVIRVFTTLVITKDSLLLWGTVLHGFLNTWILIQCIQTKLSFKAPDEDPDSGIVGGLEKVPM